MTAADGSADLSLTAFLQAVFKCSDETAQAIRRRATERSAPAAAVVIRQGDRVADAFLVWMGRMRAVAYTADGRAVALQDFAPGDFFGALAGGREDASGVEVAAVENSRLAVFLALEFLLLAEQHGCMGLALSRALLRQLRNATERMVARTTLSAVGRIHQALLQRIGPDGRTISPAPVLSRLAADVQTTRETASRAVSALERRGIIRREGERLVVVARHRLEELVV